METENNLEAKSGEFNVSPFTDHAFMISADSGKEEDRAWKI